MVDEKTICYEVLHARFFFIYVLATSLGMGLAHDPSPHGLIRDLESPFEKLAEWLRLRYSVCSLIIQELLYHRSTTLIQ